MEFIPLWGIFWGTVFCALLCHEIGFRMGCSLPAKGLGGDQNHISALSQATLALLAFLLAFCFGVASDRFNDRRELVIEEANAIGTTYLRADFLEPDVKARVQSSLKEYVAIRQDYIADPKNLKEILDKSDRLEVEIWQEAVKVGTRRDSELISLFVDSLNNMIDLQSRRIAASLYARLPPTVWLALYLLMALSFLSIGYQAGNSTKRGLPATLMMTFALAIVLTMVADLDRATEGFLKASLEPMRDLAIKMGIKVQKNPGRQKAGID